MIYCPFYQVPVHGSCQVPADAGFMCDLNKRSYFYAQLNCYIRDRSHGRTVISCTMLGAFQSCEKRLLASSYPSVYLSIYLSIYVSIYLSFRDQRFISNVEIRKKSFLALVNRKQNVKFDSAATTGDQEKLTNII